MNTDQTLRSESDRSLKDWLQLARDGWFALVVLVAAGVACGLLAGRLQPVSYESVGTMVVSPNSGFLDPAHADQLSALTTTVERLADTPAVLDPARLAFLRSAGTPARRRARAALDTTWISRHLRLTQPQTSSIIELTGAAGTQRDARDLTSAAVLSLARVINNLGTASPGGKQNITGISVHVFARADDQGKVSPTPSRNLIIGTNLGLLLGIPAALGLGAMRRRLRRPQDLTAVLDAPVLARVRTGKHAIGDPGVSLARAQMQALGLGERGDIVLITGTVSAERIADIATRLARSFTETHRRAVLVDADLANGSASRDLHVSDHPGLGDSLNGQTFTHKAYAEMVVATGGPTPLMVLPAGATFPDPSAALGDRRLPGVVDSLRNDYDVIVIAGPSLDRRAEIVAITPLIDHALVVTVAGTRADRLEAARLLGRRIFGILLVDRA
jgi:Mrp family chromosome partitioning ATPase